MRSLAPIGISTYSRKNHLKQTIEALQNNTLAKESELYIFSDAAKPGDEDKILEVREYIHRIKGFKSVNIIERETNCYVTNTSSGVKQLLEEYGRCIVLEEDIVTAPGFLRFMNKSLNFYEKDEEIFSISGYCPPIKIPDDYNSDVFILRRFSAWGYGIWNDSHKKISYLNNAEVLKRFSNKNEVEELSKYGEDLLNMILLDASGKINAFDVKIFYHQFLNKKYTIYPRKSLVRNIGHDGSGIHCPKSNRFDVELWGKKEFEITEHVELDERIVKSNYRFRQIGRAHNSMKHSNLSIPENIAEKDNLGENLVFLISLPRSGSTLLQRLLAGHPDIHTTAEPWIMLHPLYALKNSGISSEFGSNYARQGLEDFLSQVPEQEQLYIQALRQMGNMLYSRVLEEAGKRIFLDKTPRYYLIMHELIQVFPKAKFVILFRNPLSVLSSTLKTWFKNDILAFKKDQNYFDLIKGPQYLIQGMLHLKEKAIIVKYEELVQAPGFVLRKICSELGISYQAEMLNYGDKPKPKGRLGDPVGIFQYDHPVADNINKWQGNISSIELVEFADQYLNKLGPDIVSNMGYNLEDLKNKLESHRQLCQIQKEKHKKIKNLDIKGDALLKNSEFDAAYVGLRDANNFDLNIIENQNNIGILKYQKRDRKNGYKSTLSKKTKQCISADSFASFTYSRNSHFPCFKNNDLALYHKKIDPNDCDLKVYQDLLVYSFILENIPKGTKILEIGGGESRVLNAIKDEYECWNIDKLEGRGSGPISVNASGYRLVKAYIGDFSESLPDNYFGFVFSISALEHVGDGKKLFQNICSDIDRVLKPGGYSLHCFDIIIKRNEVWTNDLLLHMFQKYETINTYIPLDEIKYDKDLYYMSRHAYVRGWEQVTKKPYEEFGRPVSYNILWQKQDSDRFCNKSISIGNVEDNSIDNINKNKHAFTYAEINRPIIHHGATAPKISIITPSYNQCEFIEECIDSILSQNYPNLEYIIMDGGSTDGSVEIIKKHEKNLSFWRSAPDAGQYDAINQGFKRSTGQIMSWLNSDDKYHENSLLKAAYIFNQNPSVEWITGRPTAWKENGDLAWVFDPLPVWDRKTYLRKALKKYYIQQESTFWRTTLWRKAGARLRTDLKFAGDLELWVRFFRYEKLYTVDTILGGYRHQRNQKTKLNMGKYIEESEQIVRDEIANIQKGKFSSMRNAPSPILIDAHDFNNYKQRSLPNQETGEVAPGRKGQRDQINFQSQNATSSSFDMPLAYLGTGQDPAFTIATSIAPHEIELQIKALESWRNFGFDVVSINSQAEIDLIQEFFPEVRFVSATRNGIRKFGKPYVYFDDLLEYFRGVDSEICGIVNSDIHLIHDKGIVPYILKEAKNSLVYGSRVEIESLNNLSGKFYDDGFDFFFFDKSLLSCFPKSETFIGVTWWDFWAPLIPALEGVPIKKLVAPFAYHISHPNRWDERQWAFMGKHISDYLYRQRDKIIANQCADTPLTIFDAIHSNATHLYFIDQDLDPEERVKISYQKIDRVALSISTFLKKISIPLQYGGLPPIFDVADHNGDLGAYDLNKCGEVLIGKGDLEGACRCFSMTIEKDPNFASAHTNAGVSYFRLGDSKGALQHFKTALAIDPTDRIATLFWAKALIDLHLNEAVRKHLSSYLFKTPGDLVIGKLIDGLEKGDDLSKLIDLEIDISLKSKTSKICDVTRSDDNYRIGYAHQNLDAQANLEPKDACQKSPSLETDSKIDSINKVPIKDGIVGSSRLQAMPLTQKSDIGIIQKKFPIRSIPNNNEGLIEVYGIEGFLAEKDIIQLYSIAYNLPRDGRIIEIGSYLGLSTHVMAQALIDSQNHGACIYCIDDWVEADAYFKQNGGMGDAFDAFRSNLKRVGVDKYIQIKKKKSLDAVAAFPNDSADLVFLDGDHSFEGCYADLGAWYPKVKPKGILSGHDYADSFEGIPKAVQKFVNENQLDSDFNAPLKGSSIFEIRKPHTDAGITGLRVDSCRNPLISVITPSYNQSQFIEQTIKSVLNQGCPYFEHIIMDGGSTDGTIKILKKFPHLKWISEKDNGQAEALNKGLKLAQGDIIAWINSDDWYEPGTFEVITSFFKTNPTKNVVMANCNLTDEKGIIFDKVVNEKRGFEELKKYWIGRSIPTQPAVFFRRKLLDRHGYIDETLHYAMDYDLWLRFAQKNYFHHLDVTVVNYRFHQAAKGGDQDWNKFVPEWKLVSGRYTKSPESTPLVSVIIPCYNYGSYLRESVESVTGQTYQNFEIIIVNDGSTDNTKEVAAKLINEYSQYPIRLLNQDNSGQPAIARNNGIAISNGDFILPLDADDKLHPKAIENYYNEVKNYRAQPVVAFGWLQSFGSDNSLWKTTEFHPHQMFRRNQIPASSLFHRSVWELQNGYRSNVPGFEDWDFWIGAIRIGAKFCDVGQVTTYYRKTADESFLDSGLKNHEWNVANIIKNNEEVYEECEVQWAEGFLSRHLTPPERPEIHGPQDRFPMVGALLSVSHPERYSEKEVKWANSYIKKYPFKTTKVFNNWQTGRKNEELLPITAIIAAYNEGDVIYPVIRDLVEQDIQVVFIDHHSSDNTLEEVRKWESKGVVRIESFPEEAGLDIPRDVYSWRHILRRKQEIAAEMGPGWYLHTDADEFRESPWLDLNLRQGIERVDLEGFSAINFKIYDFKPTNNSFEPGQDVRKHLTHYDPDIHAFNNVQIKCWKNIGQEVNLWKSGGHAVAFEDRKVYPVPFILRHYAVRSQRQGLRKVFQERKNRFDTHEREARWHDQYEQVKDTTHNFLRDEAELIPYDREKACQEVQAIRNSSVNGYYEFARPEVQAMVSPDARVILDVGCASGRMAGEIKSKLKVEVWGIEPVEMIAHHAEKVLDRVIAAPIEQAIPELPDGYFDCIICADVLEHLQDPDQVLIELKAKLKSSGEIIASIPNVRHWSVVKGLLEGRWEYTDAGILDRTHLKFFTRQSVQNLFRRTGFQICDMQATSLNAQNVPAELVRGMEKSGLRIGSFVEDASHYQYLVKGRLPPVANALQSPRPMVSIIILTFNELDYTKKCVDSIRKHTHCPHEIIFVDNASSDGTLIYLNKLLESNDNFQLIVNDKNLGFAAGNNQGIEAARGDYVLLMNNDIVATPGWLEHMVSCAERDPKIGIVGPMSNSVSGPQLVKDVTYNTTDLNGLDDFAGEFSKRNAGKAKRFMRVVGFCMLIKRAVVNKIGGLDSIYGLGNFEDDDFSLRAALAGFESWMAQDCFIHHFGHRTFIGANMDYNSKLTENWEIFKDKWGLPTDLQLGANYNWAQILKEGFVREKHCCPINQGNSMAIGQTAEAFLLVDAAPSKEIYQKVQRLVKDGRQEAAVSELEKLLEMDPDFAMAHNDLGILYYNQGDQGKALNHYELAVRIEPHNLTFQKNLADFYFVESGRVEDALAIYNKVLEVDFADVEALMSMGLICEALQRPEDARHFYNRVLEAEPWNVNARQQMENLYPN